MSTDQRNSWFYAPGEIVQSPRFNVHRGDLLPQYKQRVCTAPSLQAFQVLLLADKKAGSLHIQARSKHVHEMS
jgi:hypothetical protein